MTAREIMNVIKSYALLSSVKHVEGELDQSRIDEAKQAIQSLLAAYGVKVGEKRYTETLGIYDVEVDVSCNHGWIVGPWRCEEFIRYEDGTIAYDTERVSKYVKDKLPGVLRRAEAYYGRG